MQRARPPATSISSKLSSGTKVQPIRRAAAAGKADVRSGVAEKNAEAIAEFNRTVELAPNSDEAYRRLGNAYVKSKNKELALRNLLKA